MKSIFAAVIAMLALVAAPAAAEVRSYQVCQNKTLTASSTTNCSVIDVSACTFLSFQVYCNETTDDSMSIDVDWIAGSANGTAYLGVPILSTGSAMSQLISNRTTEAAWSTLQSLQPPVSPVGTLRFTNDNNDDDIICSAILNCGVY